MNARAGLWLLLPVLAACPGAEPGGVPDGFRVVTGRVHQTEEAELGVQAAPVQLVALYTDGACDGGDVPVGSGGLGAVCASFSDLVVVGQQGGGVGPTPFSLLVRCERAVNLLVQTPDPGLRALGRPLALLRWPDGLGGLTSLLPPDVCRDTPKLATVVLDLAQFTLPEAARTATLAELPALTLGAGGAGANPLATIDTDDDVAPNLDDPDDDGDGILDVDDPDADGDGLDDADQLFTASWLD